MGKKQEMSNLAPNRQLTAKRFIRIFPPTFPKVSSLNFIAALSSFLSFFLFFWPMKQPVPIKVLGVGAPWNSVERKCPCEVVKHAARQAWKVKI